jgi:protein-S-isoprenylcysteine O-methyltransferase Ste14
VNALYPDLVCFLWAAWGLYWMASATNVKETRRREPLASRTAHFIPMIVAAGLIVMPPFPGDRILFDRFVPLSAPIEDAGCLLVLSGLALCAWARLHLGRNWSGRVTLKEDHELIRSGPYSLVRHPIYAGLLLAIAGTALVEGQWRGVMALLLMLISFRRKLRIEERLMKETFGEQYRRYCEHTAALIPYLL